MTPGRFITLEGGEGVGKSTQLRLIADELAARGHVVRTTREPGGSPGAEDIRALILSGDKDRWDMRTEAMLFAAARADHLRAVIKPALERGEWVICDRFIDSSRAYQGAAGGLGDSFIMELHQLGSDGFLPDRTLVLDLPDEVIGVRAQERDQGTIVDRIGDRNLTYHRRVAQAFREYSAQDPARVRLVDASGERGDVTARLIAAIADL
jgi:dTMP kinase